MSLPIVLIVEDEAPLLRFLSMSLRRHGYQVIGAAAGREALSLARSHNPDLMLLDLGLPDLDGMEVLRTFREWSSAPVVILSARYQEGQKVQALDLGADDYLTKPFGTMELLARLRVAMRHAARKESTSMIVTAGDLSINLEGRVVTLKGEAIHLTPLEYRLLAALAQRRGKVATHHQLLTEVWGPSASEQTHYLHTYLGQLRQKLEPDPTRPRYFLTEMGVGYRLMMGGE